MAIKSAVINVTKSLIKTTIASAVQVVPEWSKKLGLDRIQLKRTDGFSRADTIRLNFSFKNAKNSQVPAI